MDRPLGRLSQAIRSIFLFRRGALNARPPISPPVACGDGRYEGKRVTGHWSIKNGRLCLSFPTNPNSECWTVIRNRDGTLQLFTVEGVPAGYLEVVRDNPNKF
jgi:hypothetical protein